MENENLQHPLHKSIIVATITATVCFLLFGAFLLLLIFVINISIFGLFDNHEKPNAYEDIFIFIALFIAIIINTLIATKAALYMVSYNRVVSSKVVMLWLPTMYFFFLIYNSFSFSTLTWQMQIIHLSTLCLILLTSYYSGYRQVKIREQRNS